MRLSCHTKKKVLPITGSAILPLESLKMFEQGYISLIIQRRFLSFETHIHKNHSEGSVSQIKNKKKQKNACPRFYLMKYIK